MEPVTKTLITDITAEGTVSVLTQTCIEYNGQEIALNNHREALAPGQFNRAKEILPENLCHAVQAIWTPEIVAAWEAKQAALSQDAG